MATKRDLRLDGSGGESAAQRGFALAPGETAEQFLAERDQLLKSVGIEPKWPGAQEIRRKLDAGELRD